MSSSFMTALPTASHLLQKLLPAARVPGVDRIDRARSHQYLNLRECLTFQLQPEQVTAPAAQLPDRSDQPLGHLLALETRAWVRPQVGQLDVLHRNLSILPAPRR